MPADRDTWARAYARQSRSDFRLFAELLSGVATVEACHRYHYLQMACEKIAKAYRFRDTAASSSDLWTSHVAFSKFIESFLTSPPIKVRYRRREGALRSFTRFARRLAREIEKLAPAVDRDQSPGNVEYPWLVEDTVVVPCEFYYPSMAVLAQPDGRRFLKLIQEAIVEFETIRIN